ncbi:SufE family protein [Vibrio sp.]|jgi:cysteine desulfuration protein SufE|uniref:SufE family protein n=1 Tax=Vibrio sp. TaxID=678 RepID=UPI0007475895|nr:MAG: Fe-S metabolism associated SufE [Marinimicrobia bacterium 46_43]HAF49079.1 Fe-S metabolism protein SufE [Anaerolineaceae bacterium]
MKSIEQTEQEIIEEFEQFPDIDSKYSHLFKLGNDLPEMNPSLKNEDTLVKGCQSKLWFQLSQDDGKLHLHVDSDSMVIKGIGALFVRLVEGRQAEEIGNLSLDFIDRLNVWKLASDRNNGLLAMIDHLHKQAEALSEEH